MRCAISDAVMSTSAAAPEPTTPRMPPPAPGLSVTRDSPDPSGSQFARGPGRGSEYRLHNSGGPSLLGRRNRIRRDRVDRGYDAPAIRNGDRTDGIALVHYPGDRTRLEVDCHARRIGERPDIGSGDDVGRPACRHQHGPYLGAGPQKECVPEAGGTR